MLRVSLGRHIDAVGSATSFEEAARWIVDIGETIGLDRPGFIEDFTSEFVRAKHYGGFLGDGAGWTPTFLSGGQTQSAHKICPIGRTCRASVDPFVWTVSGLTKASGMNETCMQVFWRKATDAGIVGGLTVPVHMPLSRVGAVGWLAINSHVDFDRVLANYSHDLRLAAHLFLAHAYRERTVPTRQSEWESLTDRELECLTWVAMGKTDSEIGELIGRSTYTARFSCRKRR